MGGDPRFWTEGNYWTLLSLLLMTVLRKVSRDSLKWTRVFTYCVVGTGPLKEMDATLHPISFFEITT